MNTYSNVVLFLKRYGIRSGYLYTIWLDRYEPCAMRDSSCSKKCVSNHNKLYIEREGIGFHATYVCSQEYTFTEKLPENLGDMLL